MAERYGQNVSQDIFELPHVPTLDSKRREEYREEDEGFEFSKAGDLGGGIIGDLSASENETCVGACLELFHMNDRVMVCIANFCRLLCKQMIKRPHGASVPEVDVHPLFFRARAVECNSAAIEAGDDVRKPPRVYNPAKRSRQQNSVAAGEWNGATTLPLLILAQRENI